MAISTARDTVARILVLANTAVSADNNGNIELAARSYERAILLSYGEEIKFSLTELQKPKLEEKIKLYQARLRQLTMFLDPLYDSMIMPPETTVQDPPITQYKRPYWFMRTLMPTMNNGEWLGPDLFIPLHVWAQDGAKLEMISVKYDCTEHLIEYLSKISRFSIETNNDLKELEECLIQLSEFLHRIQVELSKKLRFIPAPETDKTVSVTLSRIMGAKKEKLDYNADYFDKVYKLFDICQFVPHWIEFLEGGGGDEDNDNFNNNDDNNNNDYNNMHNNGNNNSLNNISNSSNSNVLSNSTSTTGSIMEMAARENIKKHLLKLSTFFHVVFCPFVMKDFHKLIDRYLRNGLKSFTQVIDTKATMSILEDESLGQN